MPMKKLLLLLLCLITYTVSAADAQRGLIQPKGSTLKLAYLKEREDLSATFSGEMWVSGTLVAEWMAGTDEKAHEAPDYVLVPDAISKKKLPYFRIREGSFDHRYMVRTIDIQNGREALLLSAGEEKTQLLLNRKLNILKVTGAFLLNDYSVGIECDAPWARASVRRARVPDPRRVAKVDAPEGC